MVWSLKFSGNTSYHRIQRALRSEGSLENRADPNGLKIVDSEGRLILPEEHRNRWGLTPGMELVIQETPDGLLLRPLDPPLKKVYVEPTSR